MTTLVAVRLLPAAAQGDYAYRGHLRMPSGGIDDRCHRDRTFEITNQSMDPTASWPCRHDGDLEPPVCLDAIYWSPKPETRWDVGRDSGDVLVADRSADLLLPISSLPCRSLRTQAPDLARCDHVGRKLGARLLCRQFDGSVYFLWRHRRLWNGYHICGDH